MIETKLIKSLTITLLNIALIMVPIRLVPHSMHRNEYIFWFIVFAASINVIFAIASVITKKKFFAVLFLLFIPIDFLVILSGSG